jgi:hypothetical protein
MDLISTNKFLVNKKRNQLVPFFILKFITTIRKFKNLKSPLFLVSTKKTNIHGTLQTM